MKTFKLSLLALCMIVAGPLAHADDAPTASANAAGAALSFDQVREACLNPAKFHNQIAPANIQVSCTDSQTRWVPDADASISMASQRQVMTSIASDKYSVYNMSAAVGSAAQAFACPHYKQITETVQAIQAVTCDQLVAFTGNAIDYCVSNSNSLRGANPAAITVVATGRVMSLCGQTETRSHEERE